MWREVPLTVNGYSFVARYSDEAYGQVLKPLLARLAEIHSAAEGSRTIVFLAGPPAAGKSTLVTLLERMAGDVSGCDLQAVGLDGFHHRNEYLLSHTIERDGLVMPLKAIKGAPETFDTARFSEKLRELRDGGVVSWPVYDRTIHDPRENALQVVAPIVLVEGNWLLLDEEPWRSLASLADYTVFLWADEADVRERAISRKAEGGISREEAEAHYDRTDGPNVRRVLGHSVSADLNIKLLPDGDLRLA